MLELIKVNKYYKSESSNYHVLKDINVSFPDSGLVSILGQSGCGKTTLLNIIGGLDNNFSGELIIDGKNTNTYKASDWDAYRNAQIGFIFQNYNLISHLSVIENVMISLSLSGVSHTERYNRAKQVLEEVGLGEFINKKPNQLSGGQKQRVAIARALVNNPNIILADEPTGALDSETSIKIMELLKQVAKDRLVIMVTHNQELANEYSDDIIRIKDGAIVNQQTIKKTSEHKGVLKNKKTKMSLLEACKISFKNLLTKKGRTIITSLAGSIGIVGVALVLSIANGMNGYIHGMQQETLSSFPIYINQETSTDELTVTTSTSGKSFPDNGIVQSYNPSDAGVNHINKIDQNYLDYLNKMDKNIYSSISYNYSYQLNMVTNDNGNYRYVQNTANINNPFMATNIIGQLPDNQEFVLSQYDVLAGNYPTNAHEAVLIVNSDNKIETQVLEGLGIGVKDEYQLTDFLNKEYKLIDNNHYYKQVGNIYVPNTDYQNMYNQSNTTLKITGVMRIKPNVATTILPTGLYYDQGLSDELIANSQNSNVVASQKSSVDVNVLTGQKFKDNNDYQKTLSLLGGSNIPNQIQIYPNSYDNKQKIIEYLNAYNQGKSEDDQIIYSDISQALSNSMTMMVSTVSAILIAFAGISLIVSSIMIGIITYVSVIERTKEIGILRALGARRKDITRIFIAESGIIGLLSGLIGVGFTMLINMPMSQIISSAVGGSYTTYLNWDSAVLLIMISLILTMIAGVIPARIAAKKDAIESLRAE